MISFLINRARRHWQVLCTVLFGVLVSTAFLASGLLIVNTVMDFALPHKLRSSLDENGTIYLATYNNQGSEVYKDHIADINNILKNNFSEFSEVVNVIVCLEDDHVTVWPQHKVEEFIQLGAPGIAHFKPQYNSAISSNGNALKVEGISRVFELGGEKIHALKDVSFDVRAGKLALIRGRSGSGKTTLLNLIAALDQPTNGEIRVGNLSVTDMTGSEIIQYRRKQISFIFQTFGLLPYLTVEENVEIPLRLVNTPRKERQERIAEALSLVSLDHRAKHRTYELSGGEQQRVAISRALVNRPSILLADEPTGQLDSSTGATIIGLLHEIAEQFGVTVIVASHDPNIIRFADTIIEFEDGKLVNIKKRMQ